MNAQHSVSRPALLWLLGAEALVLVPLWFNVPLWLAGLWLACSAWRAELTRRRSAGPGRVLKLALLVATLAALYVSVGTVIGLEFAAALLVAASVLKLLEVHSSRDARVVVMLGFFCLAVGYLFDASLAWALYSLLPLCALLAALVALELPAGHRPPFAPLRRAGLMLAQALPLLLLLFVFFPRIGPLWSLPMPGDRARTGLSDTVAPGDIAELAQSAELAFRVSFDGPVPPRQSLYWRALTLDRFDGSRWTQSDPGAVRKAGDWQPQGPAYRYRVIEEASGQPWLFMLDIGRLEGTNARQGYDFRWQRPRVIDQALSYEASAWPQALREPNLADAARRPALALPAQGNPRSRELAQTLAAATPEGPQRVQALLRMFNQQDFHYTLRPNPLGADSIDGFLFDSRRGFCLHYAGAMTFLLRAMGVPARIVIGYQGGEFNPRGSYLSVRQYDAHAWVEYWAPGLGWTSVDPTAAVAPQRVEAGLAEALAADEPFLAGSPFSALRYRQFAWLNELRLGWENLNYGWERWVLSYQEAQQRQWLSQWFAGYASWVLPLGGGITLLILALALLRPARRRTDPLLRRFQAFERMLGRHGLLRSPGEGPHAFAARASAALPAQAQTIQAFAQAFGAARYGAQAQADRHAQLALQVLKRQLRQGRHSPHDRS
ncbi:transglutaminaseTgpA domain-containing protein [Pseudomonas sp. RIT-PI-S]|uniref:transglutaminase family protein n=1 Tax=Pseudomonas sp. RIT-PI-S TaxID=3035295 RepID=UPI0021D817A1|nr:transglutaminaseTgpA domain-containing protein [Pseudomonas sp. RIT-PI-S]